MGRCRSCDAPIVWAETQATKDKPPRMIPLDADPTGRQAEPTGNGNIVLTGVYRGDGLPIVRYSKPGPGQYVSHFATCPDAKRHRRSR